MPYAIQFQYQHLAVPAVCLLIAFLAYTPQLLIFNSTSFSSSSVSDFYDSDSLQWDQSQKWKFNGLVLCIWITYYRAVTVSPGRVGRGWVEEMEGRKRGEGGGGDDVGNGKKEGMGNGGVVMRQRYCRKCECVKPPRAHHCKVCKRCIPKMDHHCPWTANCVSHFTFPHFMRFLFYATTTLIYLEYLLYLRAAVLWTNRHMPSYLGPSATQLAILTILLLTNTTTLFALSIITLRTIYDLGCNTTTIETWEIERHTQLLRRARAMGGYLDGPDGLRVPIVRQEFPYDIGIWKNICQGMGSGNFIAWFWPLARTRKDEGLEWETNGFEDENVGWPPPDPDRMPRLSRERRDDTDGFVHGSSESRSREEEIEAFRRRQEEDLRRRGMYTIDDHRDAVKPESKVIRRKRFRDRFTHDTFEPKNDGGYEEGDKDDGDASGEEGWRDPSGSRLMDYGVDEEVEFYDEDDVPLGELLRRRKLKT